MTWHIALLEFKLQRRSLLYWIVLILLLSFLVSEIILPGKEFLEIGYSSSPMIVIYEDAESVDKTAELHAALQTDSYSKRIGWLLYDRIVLFSTLLMSLFSISVWSRDQKHQMGILIHSRNVPAGRYVAGKFIGLILTYGSQLLIISAVALLAVGYFAAQWDEAFNPFAILFPLWGIGFITFIYSIAFTLVTSLVIHNDVATFLLHFIYWVYCVTKIGSFSTASSLNFMTQWMIRFDGSMDVNLARIIDQRMYDLVINRGIYLAATLGFLIVAIWQYQRRRVRHAG